MSKKLIAFILTTSLISSSCSSTRKSVALGLGTGIAVGTASGAALGNIYGKQGQGAITGGIIGALLGGAAAYFIDGGLKKRDEETRKDTLFNLEKHGVFGPELTTPEQQEKERYWKSQEPKWFREYPERGTR